MDIVTLIEKINAVRLILDQVSFTVYFNPDQAINVVGLDSLDDLALEIQALALNIANPSSTPS